MLIDLAYISQLTLVSLCTSTTVITSLYPMRISLTWHTYARGRSLRRGQLLNARRARELRK